MPALIVVYLFVIGVLALFTEMILPSMLQPALPFVNVLGIGSALIPLVVIYASLELGDERAPLLAGVLGLLLDLTIDSHRLGTSVLVLASISALIVTQAGKPESRFWFVRATYVMVGTFLILLWDYLFHLLHNGTWYWSLTVWTTIAFASVLNLLLSPLFFYLVGFLPKRCGWKPIHEPQGRRYAR